MGLAGKVEAMVMVAAKTVATMAEGTRVVDVSEVEMVAGRRVERVANMGVRTVATTEVEESRAEVTAGDTRVVTMAVVAPGESEVMVEEAMVMAKGSMVVEAATAAGRGEDRVVFDTPPTLRC